MTRSARETEVRYLLSLLVARSGLEAMDMITAGIQQNGTSQRTVMAEPLAAVVANANCDGRFAREVEPPTTPKLGLQTVD